MLWLMQDLCTGTCKEIDWHQLSLGLSVDSTVWFFCTLNYASIPRQWYHAYAVYRFLQMNLITSIASGAFAGLPELIELFVMPAWEIAFVFVQDWSSIRRSLQGNRIASLASDAFAGLDKLTWLSVSIAKVLPKLIRANFTNRYLAPNQIESIKSGNFAGLSSLINLYVDVARMSLQPD